MDKDNDDVKGPKTQPLKKTSAVPLRKETVRVTLKATPAGAGGAPMAPAPAPPKPPGPSTTPLETSPIGEAKEAVKAEGGAELPDVTSAVPLRQETMRVTLKADGGAPMAPTPSPAAPKQAAEPAPTVPLGGGPATAQPAAPAPTVPLGDAGSAPVATPAPTVPLGGGPAGAATVPLATQPLQSGSSQPLPKATVQLQQTQQLTSPIGGPSAVPTIQTVGEDDQARQSGVANILSLVAFFVALGALAVTIAHASKWKEYNFGNKKAPLEWSQVISVDPIQK